MFKSEARLFLRANSNINSAKTLINECKRLIVDFDLEGNSDCKNLKMNINNCNINALVTKVENTKKNLMKLDQDFASEYMTLLQEFLKTSKIDTSNMTDEERMQYSIQMDAYARDYNKNLLYMLEKYEESGMLTDEMKQQLQYQRELVAQYDIQDKMAVLDPTTDEYISLFKQCADSDKQLINLNPSLTEEEKTNYLKEYNIQYNQNLASLINARDARLKREKDEKELQELYNSKETNSNFWHPFVESEINEAILNKKIEMGIASDDEIAYKNMNSWDRFWVDTGTFVTSTFTGLYNITEGIGDGFVMLGSAVGMCDKDWASEYIIKDLSGELYQGIQLSTEMNSYSAYGDWHDAGEVFGSFVGKVGMSFAAPWANAVLSGFEAMGQSSENSFKNGDEYWTAFGKSVVSGIGGAAEGYAFSKMNFGVRNFVSSGTLKTLGGTAWSGIKNFGATLTSPGGLKVVAKNLGNLAKAGAKNIPSALAKTGVATLTDADALIETGCVLANNLIECSQSGEWDVEKMIKEAGAVFAINYFMNFATTLAFDGGTQTKKIMSVDSSEKLTEFYGVMFSDNLSDIDTIDLFYETFYKSIENGNPDAEAILEKFIYLKKKNPDLKIVAAKTANECYWSNSQKTIVMGTKHISIKDSGTLTHELGHCLFDSTLGGNLPNNWDEIVAKARVTSSNAKSTKKLINQLKEASDSAWYRGKDLFENDLNSKYGINISQYEKQLTDEYQKLLDKASKDSNYLINELKLRGLDDVAIDLIDNNITAQELARSQIKNEIANFKDSVHRIDYGDECALSDILDAVYGGTRKDLTGKSLDVTYCHGEKYYIGKNKNTPFHEIIANYTQLRLTGKTKSIQTLKNVFGVEFVDTLESVFQQFKQ